MRKYITKASERIGVESTSRDGKRAQVVSYSTCENFIIRFCDGKEMKLKIGDVSFIGMLPEKFCQRCSQKG